MKFYDRENTFFFVFFHKKSVWKLTPPYAWKMLLNLANLFVIL